MQKRSRRATFLVAISAIAALSAAVVLVFMQRDSDEQVSPIHTSLDFHLNEGKVSAVLTLSNHNPGYLQIEIRNQSPFALSCGKIQMRYGTMLYGRIPGSENFQFLGMNGHYVDYGERVFIAPFSSYRYALIEDNSWVPIASELYYEVTLHPLEIDGEASPWPDFITLESNSLIPRLKKWWRLG